MPAGASGKIDLETMIKIMGKQTKNKPIELVGFYYSKKEAPYKNEPRQYP